VVLGVFYFYNPSFKTTTDDIIGVFIIQIDNIVSFFNRSINQVQDDVKPEIKIYFKSLDELIIFLDNDNVSDIPWTEDFVCADFTETLIKRARKQGYNTLSIKTMIGDELKRYSDVIATISHSVNTPRGTTTWYYTDLDLSGAGHAICETNIGNIKIVIEPQTDMIFKLDKGEFIVLYKGEITKKRG